MLFVPDSEVECYLYLTVNYNVICTKFSHSTVCVFGFTWEWLSAPANEWMLPYVATLTTVCEGNSLSQKTIHELDQTFGI